MVISHRWRYLFIAVPRTGSSAISAELCELYGGQQLLHKHADYWEFAKTATEEERSYFVFAAVRNPLDELASEYQQFLGDHKANFTDPARLARYRFWVRWKQLRRYRFVRDQRHTFGDFLRKFYPRPRVGNIDINAAHCHAIIHYETLEQDFGRILARLGIERVRPLPMKNVTEQKKDYLSYYSPDARAYAMRICGPGMQEWGYSFPETWSPGPVSAVDRAAYRFGKVLRFWHSRLKLGGRGHPAAR